MPTIKHIESGLVYEVELQPRHVDGVWECGNRRFSDFDGTGYEPSKPAILVSPVEFLLLWSAPERIAIKGLRSSDAVVADLLEIVEDSRLTTVDLTLPSTIAGVDYCLAKLVEGEVITQEQADDRRVQILAGELQ